MVLFAGKTPEEITEDDLLTLIGTTNETQELVDFKEFAYPSPPEADLPPDPKEKEKARNKWRLSLCTDLTAFANASGGWIICGMKESGGTATELCGLGATINIEKEIARLGQCASIGIEPPIPGLHFTDIKLQDATKSRALVIHIPRSYRAPHRVRDTSKFHTHRSGRNDEMNIDELRRAFNLSQSYADRLKEFRKQRIAAIATKDSEEVPVLLKGGVRFVLHVIPLLFSEPGSSIDLSVFKASNPPNWVYVTSLNHGRYNLEGFVRPNSTEIPMARQEGYVQIFRNGAVECVDWLPTQKQGEIHVLFLPRIEDVTLKFLNIALTAQKNLNVETPLVIMMSLVGVKNCALVRSTDHLVEFFDHPPIPLVRDTVLIPDTLIEDYPNDFAVAMRRIFDILWNTAGWDQSPSYDETGNWIRKNAWE